MAKLDSVKIVGALGNRHERDFYPTPSEVTQALLNWLHLPKDSVIWECACGDNDMVRVIRENGYECIGTDIKDGHDFLECSVECDWIITNPPFNMAEKFIKRAITLGRPFAFLLKTQYWHSKRRLALFNQTPPYAVLPLTWRPDFTGQGNSLMDMCWVVWKRPVTIYEPLERPGMRTQKEM